MPGLTLGDDIPNLDLDTTIGKIRLHEFIGKKFAIIFSHPGDFTPVCTTELGSMATYAPQFSRLDVKLLGLSCDDVHSHKEWIKDIESYNGGSKVTFPIAADPDGKVIKELNMVEPGSDKKSPSRTLHVVGPDKKVKLSFLYPASTGRNMEEVLRAVESVKVAEENKKKVATPANWKPGEAVVVAPSVTNEEAEREFKGYKTVEVPSNKEYLRFANVN